MLSLKNNYGKEVESQPTCAHKPGDFSQKAINKGQRRINYQLVEADKKLIEALEKVRDVLASLPNHRGKDIAEISSAISEASQISDTVADIIPPGCDGK